MCVLGEGHVIISGADLASWTSTSQAKFGRHPSVRGSFLHLQSQQWPTTPFSGCHLPDSDLQGPVWLREPTQVLQVNVHSLKSDWQQP